MGRNLKLAIQAINSVTNTPRKDKNNPNFKGIGQGFMNASGNAMQFIENNGFAASFLIQDGLGMLLPRAITGFTRDKDVTGHYNVKEGMEVILRESITGPAMMAAPFVVLAILAATVGRSTSTNSNLIKRLGSILKDSHATKPANLKKAFYKDTLKKISDETLGGTLSAETSNKILKTLDDMDLIESSKKLSRKLKKSQIKEKTAEIVKDLNSSLKSTSSEFFGVNTVKLGGREFGSAEVINGMRAYARDFSRVAPEKLNPEEFMHKSVLNRMLSNVITFAATLATMFGIPKIYAFNAVPPGCHDTNLLEQEKQDASDSKAENKTENTSENNSNDNDKTTDKANNNVSFTGLYSKLGKVAAERVPETFNKLFEFSGNNFTPALMTVFSLGGLLYPRGKKAIQRAPIQLDGTKDKSELKEVLIRDSASTAGVVFAVPILSNAIVKSYEKASGFVLRHGNRVLANANLKEIYGNIGTPEKINNFCKFISNNNGDLRKVFGTLDNAEELLNLKSLAKESSASANSKISELVKKLQPDDIAKLLTDKKPNKSGMNKMLSKARNLNSLPGLISTAVLSPIILGVVIPKLTYWLTKKSHEEEQRKKSPENINRLFNKINPELDYASFNNWIKK